MAGLLARVQHIVTTAAVRPRCREGLASNGAHTFLEAHPYRKQHLKSFVSLVETVQANLNVPRHRCFSFLVDEGYDVDRGLFPLDLMWRTSEVESLSGRMGLWWKTRLSEVITNQ